MFLQLPLDLSNNKNLNHNFKKKLILLEFRVSLPYTNSLLFNLLDDNNSIALRKARKSWAFFASEDFVCGGQFHKRHIFQINLLVASQVPSAMLIQVDKIKNLENYGVKAKYIDFRGVFFINSFYYSFSGCKSFVLMFMRLGSAFLT